MTVAPPRIHRLGGVGEPALLLHGFGSDRLSWMANQHDLAGVVDVHALDLPGHGDEPFSGDGGIEALAEAVAASLDASGIAGVHVVGHSLGGAVAMALAARDPARVKSLVLIAPAGLGRGIDAAFLEAFPAAETAETMEPLLHRLVSRPRLVNRHMVARALEFLDRPGRREGLSRIAAGLADVGVMEEPTRAVAAGDVPRLVVWGGADRINPIDEGRLKAFGGDLLTIEDAAHMPHVEAFKAVNERLVSFLAGQSGAGIGRG
ncbi:MAG TPA: alpha/beta fold hydrolase [Methylomirabilota bacterium]|nr:alpha/beta fold hydrolase [Methylomirabilota bacterium]